MNGTMILFQFTERADHNTVNKFMQKFYGQDSTSWKKLSQRKKTEETLKINMHNLRQYSYLKVTPVQLGSGVVMIRSESEHALNLINQMNIPYPERILDGARTKKS